MIYKQVFNEYTILNTYLIVLLLNFKSLHSVWPEPFRVGASDFFISKK